MIIEEFKDVKIAYMRRIGEYGKENNELMETLKTYLKQHRLFNETTTLLGIPLDNPAETPATMQKYDVGIVITDKVDFLYLLVKLQAVDMLYLKFLIQRKMLYTFGKIYISSSLIYH